jgi:hypothetical protein
VQRTGDVVGVELAAAARQAALPAAAGAPDRVLAEVHAAGGRR